MKTILIEEPGRVIQTKRDKPRVKDGEIMLRNKYVGFCGSDLSTYLGKNPMVRYPRVPGHEISGTIEETGTGVPEGFSQGEAVTVIPYTSCGLCSACRNGRNNACRFNQTLGVQRDGAMQEYITVPWEKVIKAPGLSDLELAVVEPLTVGFHAIDRGRVTDSDVVMVLGCGMIGAGAIIRASLRGARVIAVDVDDYKLTLAGQLGAHTSINSSATGLAGELEEITGGNGPDVVIEAAGRPMTYLSAIEQVSFTGRVVCIGYTNSEVSFATKLFVQKELDILGSRNANQADFRAVIAYMGNHGFPMESMITAKVKPENVPEAMKNWSDHPGRTMKLLLDLTE